MRRITKEEYHRYTDDDGKRRALTKAYVLKEIREGALFIYPTDTIYGLGCDATDGEAVKRLREAKQRHDLPLAVLAPSKDWVREHFALDEEAERMLAEEMPGPHTLMLALRNKDAIAAEVHLGAGKVGVRLPNHWFAKEVSVMLDTPLVITSANIAGKAFISHLDDLDPDLRKKVKFSIDEGEKKGPVGRVIDLAR